VAVADEVADTVVDEETDASSATAHTAKWTIIPPKHAERESMLKTTQTPVVQTRAVQTRAVQTPAVQTPAVPTPPGTTNVLATTAVCHDT